MRPLTCTAVLASPPALRFPVMFDGLLLYGHGRTLAQEAGEALITEERVLGTPLPLARVETPEGRWWYACSALPPTGPERVAYAHRRTNVGRLLEWSDAKSVNVRAGPDKALRIPVYRWIAMTELTWTCVGDPREVARRLTWITRIGQRGSHGYGWVVEWSVQEGGPPLEAYREDVRLRHLPVETAEPPKTERWRRTRLPLHPPYYRRDLAVPCYQVQGGEHAGT